MRVTLPRARLPLTALAWLLLAMCLFAPRSAQALCVVPLCTCSVTATPVAFPSVNPLAAGATDGVGSVKVTCGGVAGLLIPYTVTLNGGSYGTITNRQMGSGTNRLRYNLYVDNARLSIWGDGNGNSTAGGSFGLDVLGLSPPQTHTVYGRVLAGQPTAVPGSYVDTVTVTITYE